MLLSLAAMVTILYRISREQIAEQRRLQYLTPTGYAGSITVGNLAMP